MSEEAALVREPASQRQREGRARQYGHTKEDAELLAQGAGGGTVSEDTVSSGLHRDSVASAGWGGAIGIGGCGVTEVVESGVSQGRTVGELLDAKLLPRLLIPGRLVRSCFSGSSAFGVAASDSPESFAAPVRGRLEMGGSKRVRWRRGELSPAVGSITGAGGQGVAFTIGYNEQ